MKLVNTTAKMEKPKPKRERMVMIETMPQDHWFVRTKTPRGRGVWYLRLEITGLNPRLFGPFASKRQCLLFLDDAIDALVDAENEIKDACEKRMLRGECQKVWPPVIAYPVLAQRLPITKKGRSACTSYMTS